MLTDPFFFFFQAEDGIRDDLVTGVQTCALPICDNVLDHSLVYLSADSSAAFRASASRIARARFSAALDARNTRSRSTELRLVSLRSEERRVGKECRYRWSTNQ